MGSMLYMVFHLPLLKGGVARAQELAERAFDRYQALVPESPRLLQILAERKLEPNDWVGRERALQEYSEAINHIQGDRIPIYISSALFLSNTGQIKEVIRYMQLAQTLGPLNPALALMLGLFNNALGNYSTALESLDSFKNLEIDTPVMRTLLTAEAFYVALAMGDRNEIQKRLEIHTRQTSAAGNEFLVRMVTLLDEPDTALEELYANYDERIVNLSCQ